MLRGVLHRQEDVEDISQVRERIQGHLYREAAFGGDDRQLQAGVAQAGEGGTGVRELPDKALVKFIVVAEIDLEELFGLLGLAVG